MNLVAIAGKTVEEMYLEGIDFPEKSQARDGGDSSMNEKYKNILITGGAGRLGRYLYEEFRNEGYTVALFDQKAPSEQPFPWEFKGSMFIRGQLTDLGDMMRAITLSKADCVVHVAAITHTTDMQPGRPFPQMLPEDTTMRVNVHGTYIVMDACRRLGVTKVILDRKSVV